MIGTSGATVLFVVNVLFASVLGSELALLHASCCGGLGVQRCSHRCRACGGVAVVAAYLVSAIENTRGVWESRVALILAIAAASVVIRHLMRLALRSAN